MLCSPREARVRHRGARDERAGCGQPMNSAFAADAPTRNLALTRHLRARASPIPGGVTSSRARRWSSLSVRQKASLSAPPWAWRWAWLLARPFPWAWRSRRLPPRWRWLLPLRWPSPSEGQRSERHWPRPSSCRPPSTPLARHHPGFSGQSVGLGGLRAARSYRSRRRPPAPEPEETHPTRMAKSAFA
jgi:hypothetical protein